MLTRSLRLLAFTYIAALFSHCGSRDPAGNRAQPEEPGAGVSLVVGKAMAAEAGEPLPQLYKGSWKTDAKPDPKFTEAEKEFDKKNYRRAYEGYEAFISRATDHGNVPKARFKEWESLYFLQDFDAALKILKDFVESKPGLLWEARAGGELARLYTMLPSYGFRRDDKIYYNQENREGEYSYVGTENHETAIASLEKARLACLALAQAKYEDTGAAPGDDLRLEAVENDVKLAASVRQASQSLYDPRPPAEKIAPPGKTGRYDPAWPGRKKILFLYDEVFKLNEGRKDRHPEANARYEKARFLMRYPEAPSKEWLKAEEERAEACEKRKVLPAPECLPGHFDPGPDLDPLSLLEANLKDYPDDREADVHAAMCANVLDQRQRYREAEDAYKKFLSAYPKSKYRNDVKTALQELRRPYFNLGSSTVFYPDRKPWADINSRNVGKIDFSLYSIKLENILLEDKRLNHPNKNFADFFSNFGDVESARKYFTRKLAAWTYDMKDEGDRVPRTGKTDVPATEIGAYLLHAKAGKLEHVSLLVITDAIVVGKQDRGKVHYLVTDSKSGTPLADFPVKIKETYSDGDHGWRRLVRIVNAGTDKDGRIIHKLVAGRHISSNTVQLFAHRESSYAFTLLYIYTGSWFYAPGDSASVEVNAVTASDAPVSAEGRLKVFRLLYPAGEEEKAEEVFSQPVKLDEEGRAFVAWKCGDEGQFRFEVTASCKGGREVKGERLVNFVKEAFPDHRFRFANLTIETEKRTYLRGEKIRLLVGTPAEGATAWLTYEGADEIIENRVVKMTGTGAVFEIEASEGLSPNFFVRAVLVRDNAVHMLDREIFIPPGEEILDVAITPDKLEHGPATKGSFAVAVKDHKGRPVQAELSLAVFDSSVLYIQGETAGDIRPYYYGKRRYLGLRNHHSGQVGFLLAYKDFNKYKEYETQGLFENLWGYGGGWGYEGEGFIGYGYGGGGGGGGDFYFDSLDLEMTVAKKDGPAKKGRIMALEEARSEAAAGDAEMALIRVAGVKPPDQPAPGPAPAAAREFFPDTALWVPAVVTDQEGKATVHISYPDSLTTWAVRSVVVDKGMKVGTGSSQVITTKKLVARIETPRFLVEGDELLLAAVVRNGFPKDLAVTVKVETDGKRVALSGEATRQIVLKAGAEQRIDFKARALAEGEAEVKVSALSAEESDVLLKKLPVLVYGSDKMDVAAAVLRDGGEAVLKLRVPKARNPEATELAIVLDPSIAGVMLSAIPYLLDYPYECVEQTMSRFLPAALVARALKDLGVPLGDVPQIEEGKATLAEPLGKLPPPWRSPVFSEKRLSSIIKAGIQRLYGFQHSDGGFGWWRDERSSLYMTAYVAMGFWEARKAGYEIEEWRLRSAFDFLAQNFKKAKDLNLRVYAGYVLSLDGKLWPDALGETFEKRDNLTPYGKSLLALALHQSGSKERAELVVDNLADLAWADEKNGTASFKPAETGWWRWYEDRVEATAWALRTFMQVRPRHKLVDMFAKWLVMNRQGNRWYSTKDTAMAIYALSNFIKSRNELEPDYELRLSLNGRELKRFKITKKNVLTANARYFIEGAQAPSGDLSIEVSMKGKGALYATAFLTYFTKEEKIKGSGNEVFVTRDYYRLTPIEKTGKSWRGEIEVGDYKKELLAEGASVRSGDLVEVKIIVEAKNDYEYLVFEDFKPAGCEPVELKSGGTYGHGLWANMELRDEKVVFFVTDLSQGKQVIAYRLRAEIPGLFNALPHKAHAMYAPRVRAISDSWKFGIEDSH